MALTLYLQHVNLEPEPCVSLLEEEGKPQDRVDIALKCLPYYDPASNWSSDLTAPFRYWKIRDYAHAYRLKLTTPSVVSYLQFLDLHPFIFLSILGIMSSHFTTGC